MIDNIRIALIRAGLSQIQLAANLGLHPSTVSRIVNGWMVPPKDVQEALRQALGPPGRRIRFGWRLQGGRVAARTEAVG